MISETACLDLPDLNESFVVQTDAISYGLGAVLLQEFLCLIAYATHTMTPAERNYSATEQECLAILFALKNFDMYLDGATFTIQTDHHALACLKNLKNPAGRLAWWAILLVRYNYSIEYRRGVLKTKWQTYCLTHLYWTWRMNGLIRSH